MTMAIPDYQTLMLPFLKLLADGVYANTIRLRAFTIFWSDNIELSQSRDKEPIKETIDNWANRAQPIKDSRWN